MEYLSSSTDRLKRVWNNWAWKKDSRNHFAGWIDECDKHDGRTRQSAKMREACLRAWMTGDDPTRDPLIALALSKGNWEHVRESLWCAARSGHVTLKVMFKAMLALFTLNQASWLHTWSNYNDDAMDDISRDINAYVYVAHPCPLSLDTLGQLYTLYDQESYETFEQNRTRNIEHGLMYADKPLKKVQGYMADFIARRYQRYVKEKMTPGTPVHKAWVSRIQDRYYR